MLENDFEIKDKHKVILSVKNKIKKTPMFNGKTPYRVGCLHTGDVYHYNLPLIGYARFDEFVVLDYKCKKDYENTLSDCIIKIFEERVDHVLTPDDYLKPRQQHASIVVYDRVMYDTLIWACTVQWLHRTIILLEKNSDNLYKICETDNV